jgi:DHA2 family multidrug resistance protein
MTSAPLTGARRIWVLLGALGAIFIDQSASAIASSSLSSVQGAYGLGPDEGSWFLSIYNAAYYASILNSIWMIARFGRKRFLVASLLAYALLSLLCILAPNAVALMIFRFFQGLAEGGLYTTGLIVIFNVNGESDLPKALWAFSSVSLAAGALGPLVGGSLIQYAHWEDAFALSALLSLLLAAILIVQLPHDPTRRRIKFDPIGLVLAVAMFLPLEYLVNEGNRRDWFNDGNVVLTAITLPVLVAAFVFWTRWYAPHPFLDLRVLKLGNVAVATVIGVAFAVSGYSTMVFIEYAQADAGFSPTIASWVVGMRAFALVIAIPLTGFAVLKRKLSARVALGVGGLIYIVSMASMSQLLTIGSDLDAFIPLTLGIGVMQGISNQPLPGLMFRGISRERLPMVIVFYKIAPQLGTSIAAATAQRMLDVADANNLAEAANEVTLNQPGVSVLAQSGAAHEIAAVVSEQAMVLSYADVTQWIALLGLLAIPLVLLIRSART